LIALQIEDNINNVIMTPCLFLQNSTIDSQKRNSVRHKLVSLTLKRKSKITEEVRFKPANYFIVITRCCCFCTCKKTTANCLTCKKKLRCCYTFIRQKVYLRMIGNKYFISNVFMYSLLSYCTLLSDAKDVLNVLLVLYI